MAISSIDTTQYLNDWRFPRRGSAPPRNDILGGAVQESDKHQFIIQAACE